MNDAHYAVVIGINRYPGLRDLRKARGDAEAFAEWLIDPEGGGLPEGNIHLIVAKDEEAAAFKGFIDARPTRNDVHKTLYEIEDDLKNRVEDDPLVWDRSRLYIYGSGHGLVPRGGKAALLMANVGPRWSGENVELSTYADHYERCGSIHELVFLADCCRDLSGVAELTRPPFDPCDRQVGTSVKILGFATTLGAKAYEPPDDLDLTRGYFTQALLSGLRGGVESVNGYVDSESLGRYVQAAVSELAQNAGYPQDAIVEGGYGHPILFPAKPATSKRTITIHSPANFSGSVRLLNGSLDEIARWDAAEGSWKRELNEGLYRVVPVDGDQVPFSRDGYFQVAAGDVDVRL